MRISTSIILLSVCVLLIALFAVSHAEQTEIKAESKEARPLNPLCMASEKESAVDLFLIAILFPPVLIFVYLVHRFHVYWFPESLGVIFFGIIVGLILRFVIPTKLNVVTQLDPKIFFVIFLPLIIFDAGYTLDKGDFFRNSGSILLYAFGGTTISTIVVAGGIYITGQFGLSTEVTIIEAFMYGSAISATDPVATLAIFSALRVNPTLYYLVFGESVVNDAVAIVLFETFEKFKVVTNTSTTMLIVQAVIQFLLNSIGSVIVGVIFAMVASLFFKWVDVRKVYYLEFSMFLFFAYIPYLITLPYLSGIMCIMTVGIVMSYYTTPNLSKETREAVQAASKTFAFLSETSVFIFMGMALFTFKLHFDWKLIGFVVLFCILGRFLNVFPLSLISNIYRTNKIAYRDQFIMFVSGLRGAIAFSLALSWKPEGQTGEVLFSTTLIVVLITIVIFGGATFPLLKILRVKTLDQMEPKAADQMKSVDPEKFWNQVLQDRQPAQNILTYIDERFMRRFFLRPDAIPMGAIGSINTTDAQNSLAHLDKVWGDKADNADEEMDEIEMQIMGDKELYQEEVSNISRLLSKHPEKLKAYEDAISSFKATQQQAKNAAAAQNH